MIYLMTDKDYNSKDYYYSTRVVMYVDNNKLALLLL